MPILFSFNDFSAACAVFYFFTSYFNMIVGLVYMHNSTSETHGHLVWVYAFNVVMLCASVVVMVWAKNRRGVGVPLVVVLESEYNRL